MTEVTNRAISNESGLASDEKKCSTCNNIIKAKAEICPHCEVRQRKSVSKMTLLLLTFFLGGIGAHKFYLRKNWQGVLYLLFCWTYIPGVIALIEFIIYAFTSSDRLNEKYSGGWSAVVIILVVVGLFFILGILAAIVIPKVMDRPDQARVVKARQDIRAIESALKRYKLDNYAYPTNDQGLEALVERPTISPEPRNWKANGYMDRLPKGPWKNPYLYLNPGEHGEVDIYTLGADGQPGGDGPNKDIGNWNLE